MRRRSDGFTLIEVLIVMTLLAVLMGLSAGFIQKSGRGNLLLQATTELSQRLMMARNSAVGNEESFVGIEPSPDGGATVRAFRFRPVFTWACEDFTRASELDVIRREGGVEIDEKCIPSREGKCLRFAAGGRVNLGSPPWMQMQDGFSLRCRLLPDGTSPMATMALFQKGRSYAVRLVRSDAGRFDVEVEVELVPDEKGEGGGRTILRTGMRDGAPLPEWRAPLLSGRWQDLRIAYDRNILAVYVDDDLRAVRSDLHRKLALDLDQPFVIGGGYQGNFDSLVIGGIFEDDDDRFTIPLAVKWVDSFNLPRRAGARIHFLNRNLDPRRHDKPIDLIFMLDQADGQGPKRTVHVSLSGEIFVRGAGE